MDDLNEFSQPKDSIPGKPDSSQVPWKFGMGQKLQLKQAKFSRINLKNFALTSNVASGVGAIGNGTTLLLRTTLTPNTPHQNEMNFAIPLIALYQGTVASAPFQIYPILGGSITPGAYTVQGGLDYQDFSTAIPQTDTSWAGIITDNSAGNQSVLFVSQWKYLQYNSGTISTG